MTQGHDSRMATTPHIERTEKAAKEFINYFCSFLMVTFCQLGALL
jgi:hypothetical protein